MAASFCRRGKTTAAKLFPMCPSASKISSKCVQSSKRPLIRMRARAKCGSRVWPALKEVCVYILWRIGTSLSRYRGSEAVFLPARTESGGKRCSRSAFLVGIFFLFNSPRRDVFAADYPAR